MACKAGHGKTTRKAVRKDLLKVKLTAKQSLLGFPVQFLNKNKSTFQGPGDMGGLPTSPSTTSPTKGPTSASSRSAYVFDERPTPVGRSRLPVFLRS